MNSTSLDSCLFYKHGVSEKKDNLAIIPEGIVALQVDDSLICGSAKFLQAEDRAVRQFQCKEAQDVVDGGVVVSFNGANLRLLDGNFLLSMIQKCKSIDSNVTIDNFLSQRALAAYIALWGRPKLLGRIQLLASKATSPSPKDISELRNILLELKMIDFELRFQPLDLETIRVVCYSDAGFASHTDDLKSQIGYIIALVDKHDHANVVANSSRKGRRVTRSVLASELFALVDGFDTAAAIADQVSEMLRSSVPVWNAVDSRTLFNIVTKMGTVSESRLMIDVAELREQYVQRKLNMFWIPSAENCADPFTKMKGSMSALDNLLAGLLSLNPNAWVEHLSARNVSEEEHVLPLQ